MVSKLWRKVRGALGLAGFWGVPAFVSVWALYAIPSFLEWGRAPLVPQFSVAMGFAAAVGGVLFGVGLATFQKERPISSLSRPTAAVLGGASVLGGLVAVAAAMSGQPLAAFSAPGILVLGAVIGSVLGALTVLVAQNADQATDPVGQLNAPSPFDDAFDLGTDSRADSRVSSN